MKRFFKKPSECFSLRPPPPPPGPQALLTATGSEETTPDHAEDSPEGILLREMVCLHISDRIALR